jgi:hypothetical protein
MSLSPEELLKIASDYDNVATRALVVTAKKKEKKKLDPKAKVRNRGTVCVSAEQAKDKKDHFPINDEAQARNALARVQQLTSAPWYKGSLEGLKALVARKVKSKYPGINVGGKDSKKKSSEYYDTLLNKLGQGEPKAPKGTPGNPWTEGELGDPAPTDGGELDDPPPSGGGVRQPTSFQRGTPQPRFKAVPADVQEALAKLEYKGQKGESVVRADGKGDGQLGPITQFALDQYRAKNKDRAVDIHGQPVSQELMYEMIKRDASGENKTTTFDHKGANDTLNTVSAYLTQLQAWQGQKQILPKNVEQIKQQLAQYTNSVAPATKAINDALADQRSSPQEKQLAQQLAQKAKKLNDDIAAWNKFLATIPKPMTNDKPYG